MVRGLQNQILHFYGNGFADMIADVNGIQTKVIKISD